MSARRHTIMQNANNLDQPWFKSPIEDDVDWLADWRFATLSARVPNMETSHVGENRASILG
jgi:hypothetical protein